MGNHFQNLEDIKLLVTNEQLIAVLCYMSFSATASSGVMEVTLNDKVLTERKLA